MERESDTMQDTMKERSKYHKSNKNPVEITEVNELEIHNRRKKKSDSKEEGAQEEHYATPIIMVKDSAHKEVKQETKEDSGYSLHD